MKSIMKASVALCLIVLLGAPSVHAQTKSADSKDDPDYLVFQMGTENKDYESVLPELKAEFGAKPPGGSRYVGFGVAFMTLKTPVEELRQQVTRALDSADETGLPVLIKLDDSNFNPEYKDSSMVEWTAFPKPGEAHGPLAKHYWLNWGSWMALPPTPNFESPTFRHYVETQLKEGVLPPLLERLERWKKENRSYLFAGVCVGWETGIPDYRPLRNAPVMPHDRQRNITMTEDERGAQFGYASLYARGWTQEKIQALAAQKGKSVEDVTTELLFQVIHDYTAFWAKTVHDAGIPKERIYTHGEAWESVPADKLPGAWMRKSSRTPPMWVNVNDYSRPGYTVGAGQFESEKLVELLKAAGATNGWGGVEAYVRGVESEPAFGGYLRQLYGDGARLVDIFGWTALGSPYDPKRAPGALRDVHAWLEGKKLPQASAQAAQQQGPSAGGMPQSLQEKMHRLEALVKELQQQGINPQPVGDIMQDFQPLVGEQKFAEAEAVVDRALKRAEELAPHQQQPEPPSSPQPPESLQQKMHQLQTLVEARQQAGVDVQPIGDLMQNLPPLVQQQKFGDAEALVDRAIKLANELPVPSNQPAGPPPWLQETERHVKKPTPEDPDYLVYQFMGDPQHPDQAEPWVEELQAEFGRQEPGKSKYIGFGFFIQDMNDDATSLRQKIETLFGFAEKYEMPVFIHMDGALFWDRRTDGLPQNPEAVEWTAFPSAGQKTGPVFKRTWFDWGEVTSLAAAPPCFESPLFRADVKYRLENDIAAPIRAALARWRSGPVDHTYLFAGITVGNEISIADYRTFKVQMERNPTAPRPRDRKSGVVMTDAEMARGGYCSLFYRGYTADKVREIVQQRFGGDDPRGKNTEAVITELLGGVMHDYMAYRAKLLRDGLAGSGPAQMRIYTHTTSTFRKQFERTMPIVAENIPTIAESVNPYSRPGFTVARSAIDFPDVLSEMRSAAGSADNSFIVPWGAVESYATVAQPGPPQTKEQYRAYLNMLFGSGAKLVSLLEAPQSANNPFTIAAESAGVKSAIRDWLNAKEDIH